MVTACTGGGAESTVSSASEGSTTTAESDIDMIDEMPEGGATPSAAFAAVEFVAAAIEDRNALSYFATLALEDEAQGAPFDLQVLEDRLADLRAFSGSVTAVRPSADGFPDAPDTLGPACDRTSGLQCQVDLLGPGDRLVASVIVYWFGDGVTDFSILTKSGAGTYNGVGEARCSGGFELLHGGHSARYDVAVCVNASGRLEYNGADRGRGVGIRLDACQRGASRWEALNGGFLYVVEEQASGVRSRVDVFDPSGVAIEQGVFTTVNRFHGGTPSFC